MRFHLVPPKMTYMQWVQGVSPEFKHLSTANLAIFALSLGIPAATVAPQPGNRTAIIAAIQTVTPTFDITSELTTLSADALRQFAALTGIIDTAGVKPIVAEKILLKQVGDNWIPSSASAAPSPIPSGGTKLDLTKRLTIKNFTDKDQKSAAEIVFKDGAAVLGIWNKVEPRINNVTSPPALTESDIIRSEQLKSAFRETLSEEINKELDKLILNNSVANNAWSILKWVCNKFIDLGEAQQAIDENALQNFTWRKSKLPFKEWIDKVQVLMDERRDREFPTQLSYAEGLRKKIFANVERNVSVVKTYLENVENFSPTEPGGRPADIIKGLIQRFTRHMGSLNETGEKAYETFSAEIVSPGEFAAFHVQTQEEQKKLQAEISKLKQENKKISALWTNSGGKGDGKKKKGDWNNPNNPQPNPKNDLWCWRCEKFWKSQGRLKPGADDKTYACRHLPKECKFNKDHKDKGKGKKGKGGGKGKWVKKN